MAKHAKLDAANVGRWQYQHRLASKPNAILNTDAFFQDAVLMSWFAEVSFAHFLFKGTAFQRHGSRVMIVT